MMARLKKPFFTIKIILFCISTLCMGYEKPIVVVVPSYNNIKWAKWNLDSIFSQKYTNYRIIYLDDCSSDGTYDFVKTYIAAHNCPHCQLIKRKERSGATANRYAGSLLCQDDEIVVLVDGDDALAHSNVLSRINQEYQNPHVWCTWGQYVSSKGTTGPCKKVQAANIRKTRGWFTSHPRTYYSWLFKQIKLADLFYNGAFFPRTGDVAEMLPLVEMAGSHGRFISDVLYIYNIANPTSDFITNNKLQVYLESVIRGRPNYQSLANQQKGPEFNKECDVILFDHGGFEKCLKRQNKVIIVDTKNLTASEIFPATSSIKLSKISDITKHVTTDFVFISNSCNTLQTIDLTQCADLLVKTHASIFLFDNEWRHLIQKYSRLMSLAAPHDTLLAFDLAYVDRRVNLKDTILCSRVFLDKLLDVNGTSVLNGLGLIHDV